MSAGIKSDSAAVSQLKIKPEWLATQVEEIVEPELPIIDAHHHLWDPPGARYLLDEYLEDLRTGHDVRATVFTACRAMYRARGPEEMKPIGETEFVAGIAAQSESGLYGPTKVCAAIVSSADPSLGARVEPVLEAHIAVGGGRFRGVRYRTSWDASREVHVLPTPAGVLKEKATYEAIACVERLGLLLDLWVFHPQLAEALDACRAFPNLPIIIDHVGGPLGLGPYAGKRDEIFPAWAKQIKLLGALPNTMMKLGGMAVRSSGYQFHLQSKPPCSDDLVRAWGPYVETCIQSFGPTRCMFESNFPVDKAMCSYPVLWNAFKKMISGFSSFEKREMLCGTAARVYKIDV
jgi:L-fuconolactonase